MQESVRIINVGETTFRHPYANEVIEIRPGSERFVPFDVMVAFMGHPNLRNNEYENWRDEAYTNLCLFYGAMGLDGPDPEKLPSLEAWDSEGNRLVTILDDPTGDKLTVEAPVHTDTAIMAQQIRAMQEALDNAGIPLPGGDTVPPSTQPVTDELPPDDEPVKVKVGPK